MSPKGGKEECIVTSCQDKYFTNDNNERNREEMREIRGD